MTKNNQINELYQILLDNGVRFSDIPYSKYSEERQIQILTKMIRELVA